MNNSASIISKAKFLHQNYYTYPIFGWFDNDFEITINCPIHGLFHQRIKYHLKGKGCRKCANKRNASKLKIDTNTIKNRIYSVHNNTYTYPKLAASLFSDKININCNKHGLFRQTLNNHINNKQGCPRCYGGATLSHLNFIEDAMAIHQKLYNYSLVNYINMHTKVKIICMIHGLFLQTPGDHIHHKAGCPGCAQYGFDQTKPAILYYFLDNYTRLYKIGVTNTTLKKRFLGKRYINRIKVISIEYFNTGRLAQSKELDLHTKYKEYRMFNKDWDKRGANGSTEFFSRDVLKLDKLMLPNIKVVNETS